MVFSKIEKRDHFIKNGWKNIQIYATICYDKAENHLPQKHMKVA